MKLLWDSSFQGLFVRQAIGVVWLSGFMWYWGTLLFRVCLSVKLLGDSTFEGWPVREDIGGLHC